MPDAQPAKAGVVAVRGDPLAARLDRERGQERVGHEISPGAALTAEPGEDLPVSRPGRERNRVRARAHGLAERERSLRTGRFPEDTRVRHDADEPAEDEIRDAERGIAGDGAPEPRRVLVVAVGILSERADENVDVGEDQPGPVAASELAEPVRPAASRAPRPSSVTARSLLTSVASELTNPGRMASNKRARTRPVVHPVGVMPGRAAVRIGRARCVIR